jgi:hypothetical protein
LFTALPRFDAHATRVARSIVAIAKLDRGGSR